MPNTRGPTQRVTPASIGIACLVFVASVSCCSLAIHTFIGPPLKLYAEFRSEKFLILDANKDSTQLAVFGSSHLHNGFDPRAFDRALGIPTVRSLNLATQGGSQVEQRLMALAYLNATRSRPDTNCTLILELNAGVNFQNRHLTHPRAINAYSTDSLALVLAFADNSLGITRRSGRVAYALAAWALHQGNVGMASSRIFSPPINDKDLSDQTVNDRRGLSTPPVNEQEAEEVARYLAQKRSLTTQKPAEVSTGLAHLAQELGRAPASCKGQLFYMVSPKVKDLEDAEAYPESIQVGGHKVPILNLADPNKYPALYQPHMWHDMTHLSEQGAAMLSVMLAEAIKPQLTQH